MAATACVWDVRAHRLHIEMRVTMAPTSVWFRGGAVVARTGKQDLVTHV